MTRVIDQKTGQEVTGRVCTKCHTFKPFADFNKKAKAKYGVYNECRECQKISNRNSYLRDGKDKRYAYQKEKRAKNPDQRKVWDAAYVARNPEKVKDSIKRHYENNPESLERRKRQIAEWAANNPEKTRESVRKSQAKRNKDPMVRAHNAVSRGIRSTLSIGGKGKRKTFSLLGYTFEQFKARMENQFLPGMTWENYGEWHVDHIIPKSIFNFASTDDIDFKRCWALSNLQPMWAKDNHKKHAKYSEQFQPAFAFGSPLQPEIRQDLN